MKSSLRILLVFAIAVMGLFVYTRCSDTQAQDTAMPDVIDYNYHIRPILSDRCFKCHGPDANKRKANLRLDTPEGAYAAFKDNPSMHAIVPGHP